MARVLLTDERIRTFVCPPDKAQAFLWDSRTPQLAVRATPASKAGERRGKAFIFQARFQGKDIRLTIGDTEDWPLNNLTAKAGRAGDVMRQGARERAGQLQSEIDKGHDPRLLIAATKAAATAGREAEKAKRDEERRKEISVGEAWTAYLADRKPYWGDRHYADHEALAHAGGAAKKRGKGKTVPGPLAELMEDKLSSLTDERLEVWAAKEAKKRAARARLALRLVRSFLGWCATHKEYRELANPQAAKSKRVREKLGSPNVRTVVLQREQLPAWFDAVRAIPNQVISAYLQVMLLTGARPNEPLWLQWSDLNLHPQWGSITIRDKVEGQRVIGLTPYVRQLLDSLPRRKLADGKANPWVFSSPLSASGRLVEPGDAHDSACLAAGLPRVTLQGLRRSFASLCEWIEVPAGISMQVQGHAPQGVREQNYIRRPVDLLRSWQDKIEAWILNEAGVKFDAKAGRLQVVASRA